jgi:trehalose 6-phosphate phosphatase
VPPSPGFSVDDGRWRPWIDSPQTSGVFLDFDGTLAPIVDTPDQARLVPGSGEILDRLAARYARVAVISGRPVAFLADQLGGVAPGVELIGLYGLERAVHGRPRPPDPDVARWQSIIGAAADRAQGAAPTGVRVEPKGLAVTVHFRQAPEAAAWVAQFAAVEAGRSGLEAQPGKMSWELRPPLPTDKGTVIEDLASDLAAVCFAGDDTGDLPAFAALGRLAATGVATLAIAVAGPETPESVVAAAEMVVDGPPGLLSLLGRLAG